jgi:hypothetical protein
MDLLTTYTAVRTISNYGAVVNFHTLKVSTAPDKIFPACCVLISRSLSTASNSGDSSASRAHVVTLRQISRN